MPLDQWPLEICFCGLPPSPSHIPETTVSACRAFLMLDKLLKVHHTGSTSSIAWPVTSDSFCLILDCTACFVFASLRDGKDMGPSIVRCC
jgi:hypothetical protein